MELIKCISTIEDFKIEEFIENKIGVEIQDFTEPSLLDEGWNQLVNEYKKVLTSFNNTVSIHGPFLDLKPISPDEKIREVSYNRYLTTLNIGKELKSDYIIFHSQINPWINEPYIKNLNNELNKAFFNKILSDVETFEGKVLLENIFENSPYLLKELIETINLSNVKVCLDIGHAKLREEIPLSVWLEVLKDHIEYIHFHWNGGIYDEHNSPPKEAIEEITELLYKLNIKCKLALEYRVDNLTEEIHRVRKSSFLV
jgi:sugar phosphate isomerase/epimerase